jgi:hypothetical protein
VIPTGDVDVLPDLPAVFTRIADTGVYGRLARYTRPADPPLEEAGAAWADALLGAAGFR